MRHLVLRTTDFLATPAGPVVGTAFKNQTLDDTGQSTATHTEIQRVGRPAAWVLTADLTDLVQDLSVPKFVAQCVAVEQIFNDSPLAQTWFVSADVLIARALLMTGLKNVGPQVEGSDGTGPLQITSEEWSDFTGRGGAIGIPFLPRPNDRLDPILQVWAAGFWMVQACSALSEAVANARVAAGNPADPPYAPTGIDLALAFLVGTSAACRYVAVQAVRGGATPSKDVFGGEDARRDAGREAYPALLGTPGDATTLADLDGKVEAAVNAAFEEAARLIVQDAQDGAFVAALSEQADSVVEPGPDVRPPRQGGVPAIDWASLRDPLARKDDVILAVYSAFVTAGFSDAGSCALVAEVGRENDFRIGLLFGSHSDPANRARNTGFFSWQGSRSDELIAALGAAHLLSGGGSILHGQAALDEQARFAFKEMGRMTPDLRTYLSDPGTKVDFERAARLLGTTYLKWRFYDPLYQRAHERRRDYLRQVLDLTADGAPLKTKDGGIVKVGTGGQAVRDAGGFFQFPGLVYEVAGKTRNKPVSGDYVTTLMGAVAGMTGGLAVKVLSAGQDRIGSRNARRTGSTRHDIDLTGLGHTTDFVLLRDGRLVRPGDNMQLYEALLESVAAAGFPGIGHYAWGVHVGSGTQAAWGPNRTAGTLDPRFKAAIERGWSRSGMARR